MKIERFALGLIASVIAVATFARPALSSAPSSPAPEAPATSTDSAETLLGLWVDADGVTFQVRSGGCTQKSDFRIVSRERDPLRLALVRDSADPCKAFVPYGVGITFSFEELGIAPGSAFEIVNSIAMRYSYVAGPVSTAPCRVTGCSGQVCADDDAITTCEWRDEYACYRSAECARQADGACGWTETPELSSCLEGLTAG